MNRLPDSRRILVQPMTAIVTSAVAVALIVQAWVLQYATFERSAGSTGMMQQVLAAVVLSIAMLLAQRFPIHIRYSTKIVMGSVPLYLMAVLLDPPLAMLTIFLSTFIAEWSMRRAHDLYTSDIATQAGRWTLIGLAGSVVAHVPVHGTLPVTALLVVTGLVLVVGDILTAPLQLCPLTGEQPWFTIVECAKSVGLAELGQYFLGFMGALLAMHDAWSPALLFVPIGMLYATTKRKKELHESTQLLLEHMADTVDGRDPYTHHHSVRVTEWTRRMLRELNVLGPEAQLIVTAARVHDIGKMSIPDEILHKHEKLTDAEWKVMESHPAVGAQMLQRYPAFMRGAAIVRGHHERWDGKGYPDRLSGTEIPFGARVMAVVDSYDAMVSDRPYRDGMPVSKAAAILRSGAGTQWDPELVDTFLQIIAGEVTAPATETVRDVVQNLTSSASV